MRSWPGSTMISARRRAPAEMGTESDANNYHWSLKMVRSMRCGIRFAVFLVLIYVFFSPAVCRAEGPQTIVVSAEGLVDSNSEKYVRDKGLMVDDLREDARRQVVEKAVGCYVESSTLTENYTLIRDQVLTRSKGLIKEVIKESPPWVGKDGFGHMLLKAEVYVGQVQDALQQMSRSERISLLKEHGDPRISVAVIIRDADRSSGVEAIRSPVAENVLKERIKNFGYRVWSEETSEKLKSEMGARGDQTNQDKVALSASQMKMADFTIIGEAKFKTLATKLAASGLTVKKYALTSWSVKCIDNNTGEEIYFNNKIPQKQSWPDEDVAIQDIGNMIGSEFSREFFEEHLQQAAPTYQLQVIGLPSYDVGEMFKKEFLGLRSVINVEFRNFDESGVSIYEVQFGGKRSNFNQFVNNGIVKPLNSKMGANCFQMTSAQGNVVRINYRPQSNLSKEVLVSRMEEMPPASLAEASPVRLKEIVQSQEAQQKVAQMKPVTTAPASDAVQGEDKGKNITKDF